MTVFCGFETFRNFHRLITNELLTNALKYAFEGKDSGMTQISLKDQNTGGGDSMLLKISDDGIGKKK